MIKLAGPILLVLMGLYFLIELGSGIMDIITFRQKGVVALLLTFTLFWFWLMAELILSLVRR